mmetsp:Transcript_30679/g.94904  ORF Transcript_30679/g.94904 Transcript_30679/m.94904 type:complete len:301 (-) Transcript_30679:3160-4062(-)
MSGQLRQQAHAMLTEALASLDVSECECVQLGKICSLLVGQSCQMRQNVAACYNNHLRKLNSSQQQASLVRQRLAAVQEQRSLLETKLHVLDKQYKSCQEKTSNCTECQKCARQITSYEVNELQMKRRHAIVHEELTLEKARRVHAENAINDLEATLRIRVLYLELWKQGASARIDRLQAEVEESTPKLYFRSASDRQLDSVHDDATRSDGTCPMKDITALRASLSEAKAQAATARRDCLRLQDLVAIATTQASCVLRVPFSKRVKHRLPTCESRKPKLRLNVKVLRHASVNLKRDRKTLA